MCRFTKKTGIRTTDRNKALCFVERYFPNMSASFDNPMGMFGFQLNCGNLAQTPLTAHELSTDLSPAMRAGLIRNLTLGLYSCLPRSR